MQPINIPTEPTNVYLLTNALSQAQTRDLITFALLLGISGILLIEGNILERAYRSIMRLIGVRPLGRRQSIRT